MSHGLATRPKACVTSLDADVAPTVATTGDPLTPEQTRLVATYPRFAQSRHDHLTERSRFEPHSYLAMGEELCGVPTAAAAPPARLSEPAGVTVPRTEISRLVRVAPGLKSRELDRAVRACVMEHSRPLIAMQRAWFAPLDYEAHPPELAPLRALLAVSEGPLTLSHLCGRCADRSGLKSA